MDKTERAIKQIKKQDGSKLTPIGTEIFLPNHSGMQSHREWTNPHDIQAKDIYINGDTEGGLYGHIYWGGNYVGINWQTTGASISTNITDTIPQISTLTIVSPDILSFYIDTDEWINISSTLLTLGRAGDITLGDSTERDMYPNTDAKINLGKSTNEFNNGFFDGTLQTDALRIDEGGSTTISSGTGSVKMSSANNADNAVWIPINYNGTTYYVPGWTTNSP